MPDSPPSSNYDERWRGRFVRLRSLRAFLQIAIAAAFDSRRRAARQLNRDFRRADPWGYETRQGQQRFERELALIDSAVGDEPLENVMEIGCAEGAFTERLARQCRHLLAVDSNLVALGRARERCRGVSNVEFAAWDLRHDEPPGAFDLVVATSVLEYFKSPRALRAARSRLVAAVRPGGLLLIGNMRHHPLVEWGWWRRWLPRGSVPVSAFVSRHPELEAVAEGSGTNYMEIVFRRRGN